MTSFRSMHYYLWLEWSWQSRDYFAAAAADAAMERMFYGSSIVVRDVVGEGSSF